MACDIIIKAVRPSGTTDMGRGVPATIQGVVEISIRSPAANIEMEMPFQFAQSLDQAATEALTLLRDWAQEVSLAAQTARIGT